MARPVFDFELTDPDFSWLLEQYQERFPRSTILSGSPLVILVEDDRQYKVPEVHEDCDELAQPEPNS